MTLVRLAALWVLLGSVFAASCSPVRDPGQPPSADQHEVSFEIKDLNWTNTSDNFAWQYAGTGVLVTKDPPLQKGAALLFLEYTATPKPITLTAGWRDASSITTDGTGSISISIYYDKTHCKDDPGAPKLEWRTKGYLRLSPARVTIAP